MMNMQVMMIYIICVRYKNNNFIVRYEYNEIYSDYIVTSNTLNL